MIPKSRTSRLLRFLLVSAFALLFVGALAAGARQAVHAQSDTTPPSCNVVNRDGPPPRIGLHVKDTESGLASIDIVAQQNVNVNIPSFTPGTTGTVTVNAVVVNGNAPGKVNLELTDMAGNSVLCKGHWRPEPVPDPYPYP